MKYRVEFIREAYTDYRNLDGSVRGLVDSKIEKLTQNPFLGEALGNRFGINLTGFFKIYIDRKKYRVVYRLVGAERIEIVEIWGIGKRDKEEIYRIIADRLKRRE